MKKQLVLTFVLSLVLMLSLALVLSVYAQEPTVEPSQEETNIEIGDLGLTDPPPTGFSVVYMFTGVHNYTTAPRVATSIHCTNIDTKAISLTLQFFGTSGGTIYSFTDNLNSNETGTYSTQSTFFNETPLAPDPIAQGSGRVLATTTKLICTAQLLEASSITPTFMVKLPLFDAAGNLIGGSQTVYLPVILKSS